MLKSQIPTPAITGNTPNHATTHAIDPVHDNVVVSAWDLLTIKDNMATLLTAFNDIATVSNMLLRGNLPSRQSQALLRLIQTHATEYSALCESEHWALSELIDNAPLSNGNAMNNGGNVTGNGKVTDGNGVDKGGNP